MNAQVTGTKTYSMRISRAPSSNEGFTALHAAAQSGRTDLVRYLIENGANTQILDSNGRKPMDLLASAPATTQLAVAPPAAGGRAVEAVDPARVAEIRAILENTPSRK